MDVELLSKMILELVPDHSEVGLPGLGTFVSEFVPASFSDRGYTINPPYKRVTFVPGTVTDSSLVKLYAGSNGIDEDQAKAILQHFLEEMKGVLMDRKTVVFPGLGRLRATRQNNIFFITDEDLDIYPEGFGLAPISLKNHEQTPTEIHHVVEELADILIEPAEAAPAAQPSEAQAAVEPAVATEEAVPEEETPVPEPAVEEAVPEEETPVPEPAVEEAVPEEEPSAVQESAREIRRKARAERRLQRRARPRRKVSKWVWLTPLLLTALAGIATAVFMILVQVAPDFIDSLLYTPEQLRIINY